MAHQLSLILALPLAAALVVLLPSVGRRAATWVAAFAALLDLAAALPLWSGYDVQNAAFQFLERVPIVDGIGFDYFIGVDGFSALLILMTTIVGAAAMCVPAFERDGSLPSKQTCALLLVLQAALLASFMALDFLLFFLSVAAALVAVGRLRSAVAQERRAGMRFTTSAVMALGALFAAMMTLYQQNRRATGLLSFDMTELHKLTLPLTTQIAIFLLLFVAFAMLLAVVPFHTWFVRTGTRAPLAAVVMISAAFVKLGSYGLLRIALPILPGAASLLAPPVAWLCIGAAAVAAARLWTETDWRRAIAHLSLVQLTLLVLGAFAFTDAALGGSMLQQIAHGVSIAALVLLARVALVATEDGVRGATSARWPSALVVVSVLAAAGAPFSGGFTSVRLMVSGLRSEHAVWAIALIAAMASGAIGVLRLCWLTFVRADAARSARVEVSALPLVAAVPLLAAAFWIGIQPAPFLERLRVSAHHVVSHVNPAAGNAADCDTIPTPEKLESAPGAQFLSAVPCGPDGEPLQPSTTAPQPSEGDGR
jgi:NADH-quinone oxidoreductase subunit M